MECKRNLMRSCWLRATGGCGTALGSELANQPAVSDVFVRRRLACGVKSVLMAALAASRSISSGVTRHCWCTPNTDDVGLYRGAGNLPWVSDGLPPPQK